MAVRLHRLRHHLIVYQNQAYSERRGGNGAGGFVFWKNGREEKGEKGGGGGGGVVKIDTIDFLVRNGEWKEGLVNNFDERQN